MGQLHHLFPTCVQVDTFPRLFTNEELDFFKSLNYSRDVSTDAQTPTNTGFTVNINIIKDLGLEEIERFILDNVNQYMYESFKMQDDLEFFISRSWFTKTKPGGFGRKHMHTNSILSGVMYIQTSLNCGNLLLHSATKKFGSMEFSYKEENQHNSIFISMPPKDGMMIIFPSTVEHEMGKNLSTEDRYSLAFDIWFKGKANSNHNMCVLESK